MSRKKGRRCFYCGQPTYSDETGRPPGSRRTRDHIVPRVEIAKLVGPLSPEWRALNKVEACYRCNHAKADLRPSEWKKRLTGEAIYRFNIRLAQLGGLADLESA